MCREGLHHLDLDRRVLRRAEGDPIRVPVEGVRDPLPRFLDPLPGEVERGPHGEINVAAERGMADRCCPHEEIPPSS